MFDSIKLGQIISISKGKKHNLLDSKTESSKRYIQIDDLRNNFNLKYTDDKKGVLVTKDDVIIAWDGANAGTVGYDLEGFIGSTLAVLRNQNPKEYNPQYLALFLQSKFSYLRARTTGATIPHLHRKTLENLKIPKLDIDDQKKIANFLIQIKAFIAKREESIELLDELLRSSFLDMFVYSKDKENWEIKTVEELAQHKKRSMRTGPFGSNLLHSEFVEDGEVAVLGIDNVVKNQFRWEKKRFITKEKYEKLVNYTVFPNDVLITIMGTVGRSVVVPQDIPLSINTKHLVALSLDTNLVNPYFFSYSIYTDPKILFQLKNKMRGAIMDALNLTIIKKVKFHLPPIELQDKFATIVQQVESTKEQYQNSLDELNKLFASLSQKAFKGELDLSKMELSQNQDESLQKMIDSQKVYDKALETKIYESDLTHVKTVSIKSIPKENLETYIFDLIKLNSFTIEDIQHLFEIDFTYNDVKEKIFEMLEEGKIKQNFKEEYKEKKSNYKTELVTN